MQESYCRLGVFGADPGEKHYKSMRRIMNFPIYYKKKGAIIKE